MGGIYVSILWPLMTFTIVLIVLVVSLAQIGWKKKKMADEKRRYNIPPGRRGWPLVGDTFSWLNAVAGSHPPRFVHQQAKRFGKIFTCNLFGRRSMVSVDPEFNRFIMQNEGKLFQSSYPKSFRDLVGRNGIITVHGDQQRKLHAVASNMMRLDKLGPRFMADIQLVMARVLSGFGDGQVVHLQDICRKVAINLMVNQLLGASSETEVNEMAKSFSDFADGCLSVPINLPGFAYHTSMKARERIIGKINETIHKHISGRAGEFNNGVVGRLLDEESLSDDVLADFIINLLFAGNETTAKTMLFAVYFLTHCPTALKQLLEEHDRLKSSSEGNGMLTWQDYKSMDFTQCVIDETLRLGGIAIWLMREAKEDVIYQDYYIPKGSFVVPFLSAVHLDENVYQAARNFNPWRWMDPQNQVNQEY